MRIDLVTLFPEMFAGVFGTSIIKRAAERGTLDIHYTNFRDYATDKHRHVDDTPCGGGAGMVLKPEPLYAAVRDIWAQTPSLVERRCTIIFDPAGEVFTQKMAKELAAYEQLVLICGHYEGFDARVYDLADRRISVGDFVLTGGEIPAMLVVDATARMLPGVLGDDTSDGFVLRCPAWLSAVYAPARIRGQDCARSPTLGQSRGDCALAARAVAPCNDAPSTGAPADGKTHVRGFEISRETEWNSVRSEALINSAPPSIP